MGFLERVIGLPRLGIGVSTEYGAGSTPGALDPLRHRADHPQWAGFLEVGVEVGKGLDPQAQAWIAAGGATTYHFLDVNLDEPEDLDPAWLAEVQRLIDAMRPAWLCGDAGLWHFGRRERGQMLLLPPILSEGSADALAEGIIALREATGLEVLPENPPGVLFVGPMTVPAFFARVAERADTGLLVDCAHLAIAQRLAGRRPLDGLDDFPTDRIVEIHVAGGKEREVDGFRFVDDDHVPEVLPDTWEIVAHLAPRCPNLKAVVFECERNPAGAVAPGFAQIAQIVGWA